MFRRKAGSEGSVIIRFIESVFLTVFLGLFVLVGFLILLFGFNQLSTANKFKSMENMSAEQFKPGMVVRFKMKPANYTVIQSPQSGTHCILYNLDYFKHTVDSDGDHNRYKENNIIKPEQLTLTDGQHKYLIDLKKPHAEFALKNKLTYLKGRYDQDYRLTSQSHFDDYDKTIEESLLFPKDEVTVFGVLKSIDQTSKANTQKLIFEKNEMDFFKDPLASALFLIRSTLNQDVLVYVVSNDTDENIAKAITSTGGYFLLIFGVFFGGIPLLILVGTWVGLLKEVLFKI